MGQGLSCTADDGSCQPSNLVVLPQPPTTVSEDALEELIECIDDLH